MELLAKIIFPLCFVSLFDQVNNFLCNICCYLLCSIGSDSRLADNISDNRNTIDIIIINNNNDNITLLI